MLTQVQLDTFEQKITAAIEAHLASGGKLTYGSFAKYIDDPQTNAVESICPISCLVGLHPGTAFDAAIGNEIGFPFSNEEMFQFIHGFDRLTGTHDLNTPLYQLGKKLRAKYLPVGDDTYTETPRER